MKLGKSSGVRPRSLRVLLAFASLSGPTVAGDVLLVGGQGANYADIPPAVAAAADGDVILVRTGSYSGFTIDGKSLAVVADTGATPDVSGYVVVRNIGPERWAILGGLQFLASPYHYVYCENNRGAVRLQSCQVGDPDTLSLSTFGLDSAASFLGCDDAALIGCVLYGKLGNLAPLYVNGIGSPALHTQLGRVALYDCQLVGGRGGDGGADAEQTGGRGSWSCRVDPESFLFASGSSFQGGAGGKGSDASSCSTVAGDGGDGGAGIYAPDSPYPSTVVWLECTASGGAAGAGGTAACGPNGAPGNPGVPIALGSGTSLSQLPGDARSLSMPAVAREMASIPLTFTATPGDSAYLTLWSRPGFTYVAGYSGVLLERAPLVRRIQLGIVPPSGVLNATIALPELGVGVQSKPYFFQAYFVDPTNAVTLGSAASLVLLDSAF